MFLLTGHKNIVGIYALFILSIILNFVPSMIIQGFGGFLFFFMLIVAYIIKFKSDDDSFDKAHAKYMTKTVWIFSLFLLIGMFLALFFGNHDAITNAANGIQSGNILNDEEMMVLLIEYGQTNLLVFLGIFFPIMAYALYRFGKGIHLARSNKIPTNPKSWL